MGWLFGKVLSFLGGGILDKALGYLSKRTDAETERQRIQKDVVIEHVRAEMAAREGAKEIRLATAGFWEMRMITAIVAGCAALHYAAVTLDTVFAFGWRIAKYPSPMDEWEATILLSFFGVQAIGGSVKAIAAAVAVRGR